jgi:hypothetical protein
VNAPVTNEPLLMVSSDPHPPAFQCVGIYKLNADIMASLAKYMQADRPLRSILRVTVAEAAPLADGYTPEVLGRYQTLEDGICFLPHFPFERGLQYRASFDPRPLACPELSETLTLAFSLPREKTSLPPTVEHIYPSSDYLPENLLRFYVCFSNPMQRGRVEAEISLLGPDGEPAPDVLYRAPVELWDRSMRYLTILLDPGRLKRGVGPNRKLGPPLKSGQVYTLRVGVGMTDLFDNQLAKTVYKRFRVTDPVREPIPVEQWQIVPPETSSHQPLVLIFPRPLDWALLSQSIAIVSTDEQPVEGRIVVDQSERRWSFTPTSSWSSSGNYHVHIAPSLEDVCGNSVFAAFDRPLRPGSNLAYEVANRSISFQLV